jgi:ribosome-associated protein
MITFHFFGDNMNEISLIGDHITLGQLLKLVGIASTGGEAKMYLEAHNTLVNGEPEDRRGRKLRAGDTVKLSDGREIRVA